MKRHIVLKSLIACCCLPLFTACEKELKPFDSNDAWLNFHYINWSGGREELMQDDSYYSFAMRSASLGVDLEQDTVWLEVETMGYVYDQDRTIELKQVPISDEDLQEYGEAEAQAGVHYVPFDDATLLSKSYVPAGATIAKVPIVVLRDPSLDTQSVALRITFKDNGIFQPGYPAYNTHTLHISGRLTRPSQWDLNYWDYNFVEYTETIHELMIQWTGNAWDDDYIKELTAGDSAYLDYLKGYFQEKLAELNAERQAQGLDILREPDGTPVKFEPKSWA